MKHISYSVYCGALQKIIVVSLTGVLFSCTQSYSPPAVKGNNNYLVVDGFINTGTDSTIFNLSNSTSIGDTVPPAPEIGATIVVEGSGGFSGQLTELGNGRYGAGTLNLDPSQQYRVRINTLEQNQYVSDYVPVVQTPPIDSVSWKQQNQGVQIFVTTHDPLNLVKYYQWQFTETWEHQSSYAASLIFEDGAIDFRPDSLQNYTCWSTLNSTDILVGTDANLSQSLIYELPLTTIPQPSVKLGVEYSILVKQFGIPKDAYTFWQNLKTNTEELGSLFGPQPSELTGNIQCVNKPSLPVLGYVSAGNPQETRIFIYTSQLNDWGYYVTCNDSLISAGDYFPKFYNQGYVPVYPVGISNIIIAGAPCVDCTLAGGSTMKPPFWQ